MTDTLNYAFPIPAELADPWYDQFVDLMNAVDTTVASVEAVGRPRVTLVYSFYPAAFTVSSATGVSQGADGVWTVASAAPFGRVVSSFQLVGSGAQAVFDVTGRGYFEGSFGGGNGAIYTRLIVRRTGVTSLVVPSNSAWVAFYNAIGSDQGFSWQAVASLGPGLYSAELQMRAMQVSATSRFIMGPGDSLVATVMEASLGG